MFVLLRVPHVDLMSRHRLGLGLASGYYDRGPPIMGIGLLDE